MSETIRLIEELQEIEKQMGILQFKAFSMRLRYENQLKKYEEDMENEQKSK